MWKLDRLQCPRTLYGGTHLGEQTYLHTVNKELDSITSAEKAGFCMSMPLGPADIALVVCLGGAFRAGAAATWVFMRPAPDTNRHGYQQP